VWWLIFFNKNPGVTPAKNSGPSEDQCRLNELIDRLSQKLVRAASQRVRPVIPKENEGVGVSPVDTARQRACNVLARKLYDSGSRRATAQR
jgi:hypothetical protein